MLFSKSISLLLLRVFKCETFLELFVKTRRCFLYKIHAAFIHWQVDFGNFEIAQPVNPETIYNYYNYIDTEEICQLIGHQNST